MRDLVLVLQNRKSLIHVVAFQAGRCACVCARMRAHTHPLNSKIASGQPFITIISKMKVSGMHSWSSCLRDKHLVYAGVGIQPRSWSLPGKHNQPQPMFLSRVSLCNPGQPRTCYIDFVAGLEPLKACLPLPPPISPSTGEFYINLKGNRFLFAYFIAYGITVSILIAITYPLCREYCDLYDLLCGNQLQTNLVIIMQKYNFKT